MKLNQDTLNLLNIIFEDEFSYKNVESNKLLLDRVSDRLEEINLGKYEIDIEFNRSNKIFHIINNTSVVYLGMYNSWIMLDTEDLVYIRHKDMKPNTLIEVNGEDIKPIGCYMGNAGYPYLKGRFEGWVINISLHRMVLRNHNIEGLDVHHLNRNRCDARKCNLLICTKTAHYKLHNSNHHEKFIEHEQFNGFRCFVGDDMVPEFTEISIYENKEIYESMVEEHNYRIG